MTSNRRVILVLLAATAALGGGCATTRKAYYNTWEKFGYAKRERLVDNVKAARQEQVEAKKEFANALEQFRSVVNFKGGDLENLYNKLNKEYLRCEGQAGEVKGEIQSVKNVAQALFTEWEGEVAEIKDDPSLQRQSRDLLDRTRSNYKEMIDRMDAAAATMDPVLTKFKNRVLFIKANLNAQAIASLKGTEIEMGGDIDKLIREMEASIAEADAFIEGIQGKKS
jgi:Skp family chaperone for outer membrane proteins